MSLLGILTGVTNHARSYVAPDDAVEIKFKERMKICTPCLHQKGVPGASECPVCGCPLNWRLRQNVVGCPENKW